ncbi:MAG: 1-deoxy-D-xylulose-5-phosphate synthase [Culicoidibacterales bacterium]
MAKKYEYLLDISGPEFIKDFTIDQMEILASDIRQFLIETLSKTGGHVAPNLGVVELTLALHYVFDSPIDKLIFDVGHQCYIHKILTGRANQFEQLRQYQGLSGFPRLEESIHDAFETGHSSTSLSAAMGMAVARDLRGEQHHIIPIIGDGALTGGMALEALNHIGDEQRPMVIVLNDNEMSISKPVGAINRQLEAIRVNKNYAQAKQVFRSALESIPVVGDSLATTAERVKTRAKRAIVTSEESNLFDALGILYLGPIDGHNFHDLISAFQLAKQVNRPVVVHVMTQKGRGYLPAQSDERGSWHGIGSFDLETGRKHHKKANYDDRVWSCIVSQTLERFAEKDKRLVAITPAMIKGSKLEFFQKKFPDQTYDVGIAEQHAATFAGGLAISGMKPVYFVYSTFLQRAYDQVIHDLARQKLDVVIAVDRCGFATGDGDTHHGIYDISFLRAIPELTIVMPKDQIEAQHLFYSVLYEYEGKGTIAYRYPRGYTTYTPIQLFEPIPYGSWTIERNGKDATVITFGPMVAKALAYAAVLAESGIELQVVNARFIKPMDEKMLTRILAIQKPVFTIEEGSVVGGFGSAVAQWNNQYQYQCPLHMFGIDDTYHAQGDSVSLFEESGLGDAHIIETIKEMVK